MVRVMERGRPIIRKGNLLPDRCLSLARMIQLSCPADRGRGGKWFSPFRNGARQKEPHGNPLNTIEPFFGSSPAFSMFLLPVDCHFELGDTIDAIRPEWVRVARDGDRRAEESGEGCGFIFMRANPLSLGTKARRGFQPCAHDRPGPARLVSTTGFGPPMARKIITSALLMRNRQPASRKPRRPPAAQESPKPAAAPRLYGPTARAGAYQQKTANDDAPSAS